MHKILVLDGVSELGVKILEKTCKITEIPKISYEELLEIIKDYDAVIVRSATKITEEVLDKAINLKVIGRAGVGVDNIDIKAATKKGIIVLNAPNGNTNAATEHTMALMLSLTRAIPQAHASMKAGRWDRKSFLGLELKDRTLGVLGLGRIGAGVASRAQAFGMKVLAYDPYLSNERAEQLSVKKCEMDEVLANADFLTLHLPLTDETKGMINKNSIAKMKKGVRIINAARGECINLDDLVVALKEGKVAGAALDVFPSEPLGEHEITKLDNVVLTPHLGASTIEAQEGVAVDVAIAIKEALNGQMVASALNAVPVSPDMLNKIKPYFNLVKALGYIACAITNSPIKEVKIEYSNVFKDLDTRALNQMMLCGLLNSILQERINIVNAPMIAQERGIHLVEQKSDYNVNSIKVTIISELGEHEITGALMSDKSAYITAIDEYEIKFEPSGVLLLIPHDNVPGMIGLIGTALGNAGINISSMQVSKTHKSGENIMAISINKKPLKADFKNICDIAGVHGVKLIDCSEICDD
ncbi:phosphoglycerate dehydrogenase [Campylobacter sp. MG1]|uniref:phosphoglycerate dehydrogenase n=1 Tax=Campylobacter sp. MG1 TaxID=2976332 RepID=UPI00226CA47A|nr:phosphoglycerate dehydrogenase [Campylobacter sp. MG1]